MVDYTPVRKGDHGNYFLDTRANYAFSQNETVIELVLSEIPRAALFYPIVFIEKPDKSLGLFAMVGFLPGKNFLVDTYGHWKAPYIPAILRSNPFRLARVENEEEVILCFDKNSKKVSTTEFEQSVPFFADEGKLSEPVERLFHLLQTFNKDLKKTSALLNQMLKMNLFTDWKIQLTDESGGKTNQIREIKGLLKINDTVLSDLSGPKLKKLYEIDGLELIFQHRLSRMNLENLISYTKIDSKPTAELSIKDKTVAKIKQKEAEELNTLVQGLLLDD